MGKQRGASRVGLILFKGVRNTRRKCKKRGGGGVTELRTAADRRPPSIFSSGLLSLARRPTHRGEENSGV